MKYKLLLSKFILICILLYSFNISAMEKCPSDPFAIWDNCEGETTDGIGGKYTGQFKNGKYHGQGRLIELNGEVREGQFKNGRFISAVSNNQKKSKPKLKSNLLYHVGSGTGFVVSKKGHMVTNEHVIDNCDHIEIKMQGKEFPLNIIFVDKKNDIVLLKGEFLAQKIFSLSRLGPRLMEEIYVAGFPFADAYSETIKITKGVISSLSGYENNLSNFQFDAAINSGSSGGPIVNSFGNVVGVVVSGLDSIKILKKTGDLPQNSNFGIRSEIVATLLKSSGLRSKIDNNNKMSREALSNLIQHATYLVRCYQLGSRIEAKNKAKK